MKRIYKVLCVCLMVVLALVCLAPSTIAQGPKGVVKSPVPPRPDLKAQLQMASSGRSGFALDAAMGPQEASVAYGEYLAKKLDPKLRGSSGAGLRAPTGSSVMVALVDFSDLAHNNIPQPTSVNNENNTDYWLADFNQAHYNTMIFNTSNAWSLRNYFLDASYSAYDQVGDVHDWSAVPQTAAEYGDDDASGGYDNDTADGYDITDLVTDAADTLSTWTPSGGWGAYCSSGNMIDYLIIVHAGKGQEAGGGALGDDAIWSSRGSLTSTHTISGTVYTVQDYIVVSEDVPVGVLVHLLGHQFGLPDTWNPDVDEVAWPQQDIGGAGEASPSFYDPMAHGCWLGRPLGTKPASMTAWERMQMGWETAPVVWNLSMMPAISHISALGSMVPDNKALKIELPSETHVAPYEGSWMRQAPHPTLAADRVSPHILTRTLSITSTGSSGLTFWNWYDLEDGVDHGLVQIDAGSGFSTVLTRTGSSGGVWVQETLDMNPYLGQTITVCFRMEHDTVNDGFGWFLDAMELVENGITTWSDGFEAAGGGWTDLRFDRQQTYASAHYYLAEWRDNTAGFDRGLNEAYNMTNLATGKAEYFACNPGLLLWYVNPIYQLGDNDVGFHPGEGFLLAIDSHPDPLLEDDGDPWRTRVQMYDATFRESGKDTYGMTLTDSDGVPVGIGPNPANDTFWDWHTSYPYWDPVAPDNSAKTPEYGVRLQVEGENYPDPSGATIRYSIDAGDLTESEKFVDKATAVPGDILEYTIVLTNTGIADAHTVVVDDPAPAYATIITTSVTVTGSPTTVEETYTPAGIYWRGTVALTSPVTITFQVVLDGVIDNGTIIDNVALVLEGTTVETELHAETVIVSAPCLISSTKTADPTIALAGDLITYTIALENTGEMDASATVTDCIPACTTYVDGSLNFSSGYGIYNGADDCMYWSGVVSAQIGVSVWITFQVKIDPGHVSCAWIYNEAYIDDGGFHPVLPHPAWTTIISGSNIWESTKTVDKTVAGPGEQLVYSVYVYNTGNLTTTVAVEDLIPANTEYVTNTLSYTGGSGSYDGSKIDWSGTLGIGLWEEISFTVEITSPLTTGTIITNTAVLDDVGRGITYTRIVTTTVLSEPRLTNSTKEVTSSSVGYGGVLTYTITLLNDGTEDASVMITDTIPAGTDYISGTLSYTSGSGSYNAGPDNITWSGTITAGSSVQVGFAVSITLTGTGVITNAVLINDGVHPPFNIYAVSYVAALEAVSPTGDVYCGDKVSIPIMGHNVQDLQGFQVAIDFDPSVLQLIEPVQDGIEEGDWHWPYSAAWPIKDYDNISGTTLVASTLLSVPVGISGDVHLYTLHFRSIGPGVSPLTIGVISTLSNTPDPSFTPIPYNPLHGTVTVLTRTVEGIAFLQGRTNHSGASLVYGGEVIGTTTITGSYAFCPPVGTGEDFTLRIENDGYLWAERVDIAISMTGTLTLPSVTLLGGDCRGPQVTIVTEPPPTCPVQVTVTVAGPPDGQVNLIDLTFVGAKFLMTSTDPTWGPDPCNPDYLGYVADINEDNIVNIYDLVLVGNNYGAVAPSPWP